MLLLLLQWEAKEICSPIIIYNKFPATSLVLPAVVSSSLQEFPANLYPISFDFIFFSISSFLITFSDSPGCPSLFLDISGEFSVVGEHHSQRLTLQTMTSSDDLMAFPSRPPSILPEVFLTLMKRWYFAHPT